MSLPCNFNFLPHVEEVRFEGLYAPRQQIENFMQHVMQAQKLRPLIRRLHARRQPPKGVGNDTKECWSLAAHESDDPASRAQTQPGLRLEQCCVFRRDTPRGSEESRDRRKKSETWPPAQADYSSSTMSLLSDSSFFSRDSCRCSS